MKVKMAFIDSGATDENCPYSLCLNQLQAVLTSVLLLLLLFLVVILLTILFKRQKALQRFANSKKMVPSSLTSYKANSDFVNSNNQNFYLLTDNNSMSNSTDNFESQETTIPIRDNGNFSSSINFRAESGSRCNTTHYRRSIPNCQNRNVMLTSFHTMPCSRAKVHDSFPEVNSRLSNDTLLKVNMDVPNNAKMDRLMANSVSKCNEMVCMCTEE